MHTKTINFTVHMKSCLSTRECGWFGRITLVQSVHCRAQTLCSAQSTLLVRSCLASRRGRPVPHTEAGDLRCDISHHLSTADLPLADRPASVDAPNDATMYNQRRNDVRPTTQPTTLDGRPMTQPTFFFSKYTATHYQVTRSAPSREPNDAKKRPYVNTRQNKLSMSRHSQLRK